MSHLTHDQRTLIEIGLRARDSFKAIAKKIGKSPSSVSREVLKHRINSDKGAYGRITNRCLHRCQCEIIRWKEHSVCRFPRRGGNRSIRAADYLAKDDVAAFGRLWFDSHESSRVNFENSTPELDYLVELAHSMPECLGARLSGGGFGGITIHLVKASDAESYAKKVAAGYQLRTGIRPEFYICAPGAGASSEKLN